MKNKLPHRKIPIILVPLLAMLAVVSGGLVPVERFASVNPLASSDALASTASPKASTLGMRPSGGFLDRARLDQYERELKAPINWYVGMAGRMSPGDMTGSVHGQLRREGAVLPDVANRMNLVMTVPLAFGRETAGTESGRKAIRSKLLETAGGEWDASFRSVAKALVDGGYPDATIRLGHEFTGGWYPWSAQGNTGAYIDAYRHVHKVMRSVSPSFQFEWNAARNTFVEFGPPAYPGDAYVDVVGLDVYYEPWKGDKTLDESNWQRRYLAVLKAHQEFAVRHKKPVSYAEWGNGGIDSPNFIQRMHDWFASLPKTGPGSLLYHAYFNASKDLYNLDNYPQSKQRYLQLFGNLGNNPTPTTQPPTTQPPTTRPVSTSTTQPATTAPSPTPVQATTTAPGNVTSARQFSAFNQRVTHSATSYAELDFSVPTDWRNDRDFAGGTGYVKLQVLEKPSDREVQLIICMWRDNFKQETCASLGKHTGTGTHYIQTKDPERWWKLGAWAWDRPIETMRIMVKDVATGKLLNSTRCGSVCYAGNDLADHTPIKLEAQMIFLAKGEQLTAPNAWRDACPRSWSPHCQTGGTTATTTPATTTTTRPSTGGPTTSTTRPPSTTRPTTALPKLTVPAQVEAVTGRRIKINSNTDSDRVRWWKISGPGGVVWDDVWAEDVTVRFRAPGEYQLGVRAGHGGDTTRGRVKVVVSDAPGTGGSGATVPPGSGDQPSMDLRGADAVSEGESLIYRVVLSKAVDYDVSFTVEAEDSSAVEGEDYRAPKRTWTIPAGEQRVFFGIATIADNQAERAEWLRVRLTGATGATINVGTRSGQIRAS